MKRTGGSLVVKALEDEGVPFTFGIPGTHNIELYDALAESESVRAVLVTDEQSASFMADGLWRATGLLGCVNLVPGAGLTHALSGIAEAFMDQVPLLVLGCGIRRDSGRAYQLHDIDQQALVRSVVKATYLVERTAGLYPTIREACRLARDWVPGPVFVEVPANLYMVSEEVEAWDEADEHLSSSHSPGIDVSAAVEVLRNATRPLLYVGAGAARAAGDVVKVAERLEAPVSTTFQGKGVFPESHPLFLWPGFGEAAPKFVRKVAASCDAVLAIGCRFAEVGTGSYGMKMPGPLVHVDLDPEVFDQNFDAAVTVQADAGEFMAALLSVFGEERPGPDETLRDTIRTGHAHVWEGWLRDMGGEGVTPAHLLKSLQASLGPDTIYTTDSGNGTFLGVECLRLERPGLFLAPVDFSCMGYSVPAAIGAKLGAPGSPMVALAGDGAFLMTGLEMLTAAREGTGIIVLVLRDRELAQIAQFQDTALSRKTESSVAEYDLRGLAEGMGVHLLSLHTDDEVTGVVAEAAGIAGGGRPVLVDVAIDYSRKTFFTRGVVKTNLLRLPLRDQARFVGRALKRKLLE
ncbi:MAG: thiamine pyrophosphate-binding protein [Gemmatimonadota bacterium]|jgi:acetolactate synthase-1/2/3 large subunit